ncbi:putative peptide deformylase 1A, chloroplastic [Sesbania bispinosa]|nr:putative peptide deformylase 1A, chloroplastic [Sesbania bispinosa]
MGTVQRLALRFRPVPILVSANGVITPSEAFDSSTARSGISALRTKWISFSSAASYSSSSSPMAGRWLAGLGGNKKVKLPKIVKAGDPVLHQPAQEV